MNEYIKKTKKLHASDGGELMRYSLCYPEFIGEQDGIKKINGFYAAIAERCESFCAGELLAFCDGKRREEMPYKPYSYRLDCAVSLEDSECVSVIVSASLKRLGEMCFVGEYTSAQVFSKDDGLLLPPRQIIRKYMPEIKNPKKYIRKNKLSDLCPTEQGVMTRQNGNWTLLS